MKIGVHDVQHIIGQIKRARPPTTKEMHKFINNLAILLEKNTEKLDSALEAALTGQLERLNECSLDLCFLRKEILLRYSKEYAAGASDTLAALQANHEAVAQDAISDRIPVEWSFDSGCGYTARTAQDIFGKLRKAKSIIEDALGHNIPASSAVDADGCLESYLADI